MEVCTLRDGEVQWSECTAAPGLGKRMGAQEITRRNKKRLRVTKGCAT